MRKRKVELANGYHFVISYPSRRLLTCLCLFPFPTEYIASPLAHIFCSIVDLYLILICRQNFDKFVREVGDCPVCGLVVQTK